MADEKELNPSPAVVHGEYPELSPNPNFTGENEKGSDQAENMHPSDSGERPQVFKDVVMNLLKVKKDIYIRGKKIEDYIDLKGGVTEEEMEEYVNPLLGSKIKTGYFILDVESGIFKQVEELPVGYSGLSLYIGDDGMLSISLFSDGDETNSTSITSYGIDIIDAENDTTASYGPNGATKVAPSALVGLTHSFAELDETLQGIINDAIADGHTDCTDVQWGVIKLLLDNSLYLNYDGFSYIKNQTDGIRLYVFGSMFATDAGSSLKIEYDDTNNDLYITYLDI